MTSSVIIQIVCFIVSLSALVSVLWARRANKTTAEIVALARKVKNAGIALGIPENELAEYVTFGLSMKYKHNLSVDQLRVLDGWIRTLEIVAGKRP